MKNIAIICEYNPMHNGHIHQIKSIKDAFPNSSITILMSGSFVQRGTPSIIDKFDKAEIAILNGVDLVLEMPTIISIQSSDYFTFNCVNLLNKLNYLDFISFGVESDDLNKFNQSVDLFFENYDYINENQLNYIKMGFSYKVSFEKSLEKILSNPQELSLPNNTLALGYIKALKFLNSKIKIFPILRNDGGYHNNSINDTIFQSASAIRKLITDNIDYTKFTPQSYEKYLLNNFSIDDYTDAFIYKSYIENSSAEKIAGYENGLLNLILKNFDKNISETIDKSHNKRYSKSRLNRFLINYLLDINKDYVENLSEINYIRPLGFNKTGLNLLNKIKNNSNINIISKFSDINNLDDFNKTILQIDRNAYKLVNINNINNFKKELNNIPYKK